jgi:hypothetical protein
MEPVVIADGRTRLVFSDPDAGNPIPSQLLSVTLEGPELRASRQVYDGYAEGFTSLARFFEDLAANCEDGMGAETSSP